MPEIHPSCETAVADIPAGATIAFGGFVAVGSPSNLIRAIHARGIGNLTLVCNEGGFADLTSLLYEAGQVRKLIASYPFHPSAARTTPAEKVARAGSLAVEFVPQGTLAERLRAGASGIPAFWTPTGAGTPVAEGKEVRELDGRPHLLERALKPDYACIRAYRADPAGNLIYRKAARNFNPVMAMAARVTIVEVEEIVPLGTLDPEKVVTPGIFVQRLVQVAPERQHLALFPTQ